MKQYTGTKTLMGTAMLLGAYNELRGLAPPDDPNKEGYLVEYPIHPDDDEKPNVEGYEGYVSWSPKATFERHYHLTDTELNLLKFQRCNIDIDKAQLIAFTGTPAYTGLPVAMKELYGRQLTAMTQYSNVLRNRIELIPEPVADVPAEPVAIPESGAPTSDQTDPEALSGSGHPDPIPAPVTDVSDGQAPVTSESQQPPAQEGGA